VVEDNFCPVLCVVFEGSGLVTRSVPLKKDKGTCVAWPAQYLAIICAHAHCFHRPELRACFFASGLGPSGDLLAQRRRSQLMRRRSTFAGAADLMRDSEPKQKSTEPKDAAPSIAKYVGRTVTGCVQADAWLGCLSADPAHRPRPTFLFVCVCTMIDV
jgi:hypothetical protein